MTKKRNLFDFFVFKQFYKIIELTKKIFVQYETYVHGIPVSLSMDANSISLLD